MTAGVLCVTSFLRGFTVQGGSVVREPLLLYAGEALLGVTFVLWYIALRCRRRTTPIPA
jgi:hypothetical protein